VTDALARSRIVVLKARPRPGLLPDGAGVHLVNAGSEGYWPPGVALSCVCTVFGVQFRGGLKPALREAKIPGAAMSSPRQLMKKSAKRRVNPMIAWSARPTKLDGDGCTARMPFVKVMA